MCLTLGAAVLVASAAGQTGDNARTEMQPDPGPIPDTATLLHEMEANQKRMESLRKDYTYHVHMDIQTLDKQGGVKSTESQDQESLTIDGIRVDKLVAKNGKPLTPEEQQKESERIDKDVARAKERRAKAEQKGQPTAENGEAELTLSRILELGAFTNPRRVTFNGRSTILLDYNGDPKAKTHNAFETVFRDLTGTVWIDEADRVLVRGQGHLNRDFKLAGGLFADIRKDTSFDFQAHRLDDGVWLPGNVDADGAARILLLANFHGKMHMTASDYRRFRTSATIVGSHGVIGPDGEPVPDQPGQSAAPANPSNAPPSQPQH